MGSRALLVGLYKPEPFVHAPGDLGEDVGATGVLELVHLLDAEPYRAAESGEGIRQRGHVLGARRKGQRIVEESGPSLNHAHGTLGYAAELDDPLGNQIHVLCNVLVDLVEQLVQRDEGGPLHVPVRLLALRLQVDAVSEALIEQRDHLEPPGLGQIVLGGIDSRSDGAGHRRLLTECSYSISNGGVRGGRPITLAPRRAAPQLRKAPSDRTECPRLPSPSPPASSPAATRR